MEDSSSVNIRRRSRVVPKELHHNNRNRNNTTANLKPPGPVLKPPNPSPSSSSLSSSSSSSSSSYSSVLPDEASLLSAPPTPLRFSGVPFSWEKTPGIPKKQSSCRRKDKESAAAAAALLGRSLLPLPPSATPPTSRRYTGAADEASFRKKVPFPGTHYQWDPFMAALVVCSKEEGHGNNIKGNNDRNHGFNLWIGKRVSRSITDRFGFIALYGSCKRAAPISESIIYLPRSSPSPYMVMNGRSH
ncbi:hypothetical protein MLD38_033674 [Melastoma candidum]|uniref:Uncharacterized protein n=1 Tax=Melastoma candidum TaxID=119954 RepID=A0ACB9M811_9MYRT|nr:hypothetical protein MLD38_033674 [Melastoma candidum]